MSIRDGRCTSTWHHRNRRSRKFSALAIRSVRSSEGRYVLIDSQGRSRLVAPGRPGHHKWSYKGKALCSSFWRTTCSSFKRDTVISTDSGIGIDRVPFPWDKQREMDAKIAEMQQQGWTFLRASSAGFLRAMRSWGGGLTLHFIRTTGAGFLR